MIADSEQPPPIPTNTTAAFNNTVPADNQEGTDGDDVDPLVLPAKTTPRTAHAAVRRWFAGRVFGAGAAGTGGGEVVDGAGGEGEEEKAEGDEVVEQHRSVWV